MKLIAKGNKKESFYIFLYYLFIIIIEVFV